MFDISVLTEFTKTFFHESGLSEIIYSSAEKNKIYVVGGAIRDLLSGREPSDIDLVVSDGAEKLVDSLGKKLRRRAARLKNKPRPTWRFNLERKTLDIAAMDGRNIEEDLAKRDFTMNSMAFDISENGFIDPCGGLEDLQEYRIKMTSSIAILEDPLRILRAYRYLLLHPLMHFEGSLEKEIGLCLHLLVGLPGERIVEEVINIINQPASNIVLAKMVRDGIFETLYGMSSIFRNNNFSSREFSGLKESGIEMNNFSETFLSEKQWMSLFEPVCKSIGIPVFKEEHESCSLFFSILALGLYISSGSAELAELELPEEKLISLLTDKLIRGRYPLKCARTAGKLFSLASRPVVLWNSGTREGSSRGARQFIHDAGELLEKVLIVSGAVFAVFDREGANEAFQKFLCSIREEAISEGKLLREPLLDGKTLFDLGLKEGPAVGKVLSWLMERQIEGSIRKKEEALEKARKFIADEL